jgi:REP element-mobilizing transposase RayT
MGSMTRDRKHALCILRAFHASRIDLYDISNSLTLLLSSNITSVMKARKIRTKKDQLSFFNERKSHSYGGQLRTKAKNRGARPISNHQSMHLVLRSSKAKGPWSFLKASNRQKISTFVKRISHKYGVSLISVANVGNHLHLHIKLNGNREVYKRYIRGLTAGIAILITKVNKNTSLKEKFWDYRPFSRIVIGFRNYLTLKDYILINQFEGLGYGRVISTLFVKGSRSFRSSG